MVINPYADQIDFPAGTPASIINAVMAIRARRDAQQAQPQWWETGINNVINGVTGNLVMPWLQNEFVNEPFQAFKTDENIRQRQAEIDALYNKEISTKQWLEEQAAREAEQLGTAESNYLGIANTPIPTETTTGGGVNPYGAYEDPWSTGIYTPQDQQERAPTSQSIVDESGNVTEQEREPIQGLTMPADSGQANIFDTGVKPSAAEALRMFSAKYPTDAGRLGKFLGPNNVFSMIDVNKQEKARADIEAQRALAEQRNTNANERKTLLDERERFLQTQADKNVASTEATKTRTSIDTVRLKTEQGRQEFYEETMQLFADGNIDDKEFQRRMALYRGAQLQPTPGERKDIAAVAPGINANKPTIPGLIDERATLAAKIAAGIATPADVQRYQALEAEDKLNAGTGKPESPIDALIRQMFEKRGLIPPTQGGRGGMRSHPSTPSNTPPSTSQTTDPWARIRR